MVYTGKLVGSSIAALPLNHFQFSLHIHAHGGIVPWVISSIWSILQYQKVSSLNTQYLYVKMTFNVQTMTIPLYFDI